MSIPRLRMIAGPNGSGKTTLTRFLLTHHKLSFGFYINADDVERELNSTKKFSFDPFGLMPDEKNIKAFFAAHSLNKNQLEDSFVIENNGLKLSDKADGYFAAIFSDFIRQELLKTKTSFAFETVMSSDDKITLMHEARKNGYRNYLYYICTDNVLINKERIAGRVSMGEHNVPEEKIEPRYRRSLDLLLDAIKASDRAYLFDNSGKSHELIAEITGGNQIDIKQDMVPGWFIEAVVQKIP